MASARLLIKVLANAKKTELVGMHGEAIKIKLSAPPVEGKANELLLSFLSDRLEVPKGLLRIEKGEKSRLKTIVINEWLEKDSPQDFLLKTKVKKQEEER
ncbi:DUF167 domain-containing protein [Candidatus Methylacidiphilum fumarolicum]|uniref:UPF0235 protein MFUM_60007 n=2 Tax=Candidatus Methylacidiphilum fumarolicum TaxID=591154 RepID=I0JYI9_METFB|nr:DUF167 domain-containing protein [Candidatus Methylacidiphilum fumarolicum]MBW6415618.1 DUF167 domain-containing protein [Candidatus Methylacidiphilum fumarolicum]TFE67917.1 hypothetical protein A7K73_08295 [Candidatus Methylacidiphilum fumarolicum]TFE71232.1 DUF167 domain-containing protein [Candidatus Methylacidiphilum fumarolicum]TFE74534.1 DUF167 domain-containing protein [Candidatus Methylacidiphilum fumarolicum]TFE74712.1 hypothetical protein A7D33_01865 [Candidatus Methylacidiphilum 